VNKLENMKTVHENDPQIINKMPFQSYLLFIVQLISTFHGCCCYYSH